MKHPVFSPFGRAIHGRIGSVLSHTEGELAGSYMVLMIVAKRKLVCRSAVGQHLFFETARPAPAACCLWVCW